jgi:hypothetical protein
MTYQSITEHTATFSHPRWAGHTYHGICIHWWGDPATRPTFDGTIQYLVYGGARNSASVHYVAEAGRVACLLDPDTDLSWGQGDGGNGVGNNYYISIECNPRASDGDYETVAELVRDLREAFGPLPLRPHNAFTNTRCPGVWDLARIDRLAAAPAPAPAAPPPEEKKEEKMLVIAKLPNDDRVWIGDGVTRRHITDPVLLQHYKNVAGALNIRDNGAVQVWGSVDVLGLDIAGQISDRIKALQPGEIAKLIPDEVAAAVADALSKRLAS